MTDEDIKKALECCSSNMLSKCVDCGISKNGCAEFLASQALDLINRQQADIERLNGNLFTISNACMQRRNETIKEFAERLESKYTKVVSCNAGYVYRTIKEVEKEMVGGENA